MNRNNAYVYRAEDPKRLIGLLEQKRRAIDAYEQKVEHILGPLREMMLPNLTQPKIRTFEGKDQIQTAYRSLLSQLQRGDIIYSYVYPLLDKDDQTGVMDILSEFATTRIQRKIKRYMLIASDEQAKKYAQSATETHLHVRVLTSEDDHIQPAEIMIVGNTVWSLAVEAGHFFAFSVEHASLTALQRAAYQLAWNQAERVAV